MRRKFNAAKSYFDDTLYREAAKKKVLGREEEAELIRLAQSGDRKALDRLVERNIRLVFSVAAKFVNQGVDFDDLVQEGLLGLLKAIEKFELDRGLKLVTYAKRWIFAYCMRALNDGLFVKQATTQAKRNAIGALTETVRVMMNELEREPTHDELAERLGISGNDLAGILASRGTGWLSLEREVNQQKTMTYDVVTMTHKDMVPDKSLDQEDRTDVTKATRRASEMLIEAMNILDRRESDIIRRRLLQKKPDTLQTIGGDYGLSRERIRQLEALALKKMRDWLLREGRHLECREFLELLGSSSDINGFGSCIETASLLLERPENV